MPLYLTILGVFCNQRKSCVEGVPCSSCVSEGPAGINLQDPMLRKISGRYSNNNRLYKKLNSICL